MGKRLFEAKARFEAYEIVRSDNGFWGAVENVASLPIGALSSPAWLKRLTQLTILELPGKVWAQNDRPMAASWLVRLTFDAKESSSGAFRVSKEAVTRRQGAWVTVNLHDGAEVGQFSDLILEGDARLKDRLKDLSTRRDSVQVQSVRKFSADHYQMRVGLPNDLIAEVGAAAMSWCRVGDKFSEGLSLYIPPEGWSSLLRYHN